MANAEYKNLIRFVKEGKDENNVKEEDLVKTSLNGEDVREFYENLIKRDPDKNLSVKPESRKRMCVSSDKCLEKQLRDTSVTREKPQPEESSADYDSLTETDSAAEDSYKLQMRLGNELLKQAEQGKLCEIKKLASQGADINHADAFGWTGLMCASVAGHVDIAEWLLKHGADKYAKNNQGKTALTLADSVGAVHVVDFIEKFDSWHRKRILGKHVNKKSEVSEKAYCDVCSCEYVKKSRQDKSHHSSTVHLFNLRLKPKPDPFVISEVNVGYKLMRQSGWDGEKGLGPEGQGHRYPVKTTLKTDRSCIGSKNTTAKAKVTHFGPNDPDAVKSYQRNSQRIMSARTASRKEKIRRERKAKQWERNLRTEMNMD